MNLGLSFLVLAGSIVIAGCSFDGSFDARSPDAPQVADAPAAAPHPDTTKPERAPIDDLAAQERDPRKWGPARSEPLLIAEAQAVASLLESTDDASPDRTKLFERLARTESELGRAMDAKTPGSGKKEHARAAETYAKIASAKGSEADDALYYSAYENELAGDRQHAREHYLELLKRFPISKFQPYAYVAFGETALADIAADSSAGELASKAYKEAASYKDSKIRPFALFRWAQVLEKSGDAEGAAKVYRTLTTECPSSGESALVLQKDSPPSAMTPKSPDSKPSVDPAPWM